MSTAGIESKIFCGGDSAHGREGGAIDLLVPISALGQPHPYFLEWYCCDRNQKDHRASPQMMGSLNGPFEQIIAHK